MKEKWLNLTEAYLATTIGLPAHFLPAPEAEHLEREPASSSHSGRMGARFSGPSKAARAAAEVAAKHRSRLKMERWKERASPSEPGMPVIPASRKARASSFSGPVAARTSAAEAGVLRQRPWLRVQRLALPRTVRILHDRHSSASAHRNQRRRRLSAFTGRIGSAPSAHGDRRHEDQVPALMAALGATCSWFPPCSRKTCEGPNPPAKRPCE